MSAELRAFGVVFEIRAAGIFGFRRLLVRLSGRLTRWDGYAKPVRSTKSGHWASKEKSIVVHVSAAMNFVRDDA